MLDENKKIFLTNLKESELKQKLPSFTESELSFLVEHHNKLYFDLNDPVISDELFDKLNESLSILNPTLKTSESLFKEEIRGVSSEHLEPMLSLEKAYDFDSFNKWFAKIEGNLIAMPKVDGAALCIRYSKKGDLLLALTRGDGFKGEDITKNILLIEDIVKKLVLKESYKISSDFLEVRGEVFMPVSVFDNFKEQFKNPRNLAAGALKLKNDNDFKKYFLQFFPYDIRGIDVENENEKFNILKELGFKNLMHRELKNEISAKNFVEEIIANRDNLPFETDGVVFKANLITEQKRLGSTAHHPKFAIAFKFQGDFAHTTLKNISWSLGRTGVITPVAHFSEVFISGALVSKASLHNMAMFEHLSLKEHSVIEVSRRGGVIPQVEKVLTSSGDKIKVIDHCPGCDGPIVQENDFLFCKNFSHCDEIKIQKIIYFFNVLEVKGLGENILRRLYQIGFNSFAKILTVKKEELLKIERMGEKLAQKIIKEIDTKKTISLSKFIESLGIEGVGESIAAILASHFKTLENILYAKKEEVSKLYGIGDKIGESFLQSMQTLKDEIIKLDAILHINDVKDLQEANSDHPLFLKSVVFTGKLGSIDRKSAQKMVVSVGGKTPSAVTLDLDYLVVGSKDANIKSAKELKAIKLIEKGNKIKIISEDEFLAILKL